ncbi:MAG TPA: dihydrodipicolinate synthase family protein [Lacunisphaera sp.]|nr:dihydrodipicolinate synthase family protein [Lacunisphaera sp.]
MNDASPHPRPAHDLDGIVAVPATPFTADNRLDVESLRRYARNALARGVVGFLAPAVAGEVEMLSESERESVVVTLLEESAGRVPVIGGATDPDPAARLRHARRFIELGCTGVLAYVRYEDSASYARALHELGALNPGFLMIQDLDLGKAPLPVDLITRLHRDIPCFTWIKVETGDRCRKISAILDATGGSLRVGTAGPDMIELLDRGVQSYLITFSTGVYMRIWTLYRAGRRAEAIELYHRLLPCLAFMATHQSIQWHFTKALLHDEGLFTTTRVRKPIPALDAVETALIARLSRHALDLAASLPAQA